MLLFEPDTLFRRTVAMTARALNLGHIHEAASVLTATRMLSMTAFHGAIIAVRLAPTDPPAYDLSLLDRVRAGKSASHRDMPIAVMVEQCDLDLLASLQARAVSRVLLKPFRVRVLLDSFADLARCADLPDRSAGQDRTTASAPPDGYHGDRNS